VLADQVFIGGKVDAESLVTSYVAVLPLNAVANLLDGVIRGARGTAQFQDRHPTRTWDVALNQISSQARHEFFSPLGRSSAVRGTSLS
jgi:hypothetical protein